jgi:K+ transporter
MNLSPPAWWISLPAILSSPKTGTSLLALPTAATVGATIVPTERIPGMLVWRERLYAFMQRNAERPDAYFCIPVAQVVEMGIEIEI